MAKTAKEKEKKAPTGEKKAPTGEKRPPKVVEEPWVVPIKKPQKPKYVVR